MKKLSIETISYLENLMNEDNYKRDNIKVNGEIIHLKITKNPYGSFVLQGTFLEYVFVQGGKKYKGLYDKIFEFYGEKNNLIVGKAKHLMYGTFECPIFGLRSERVEKKTSSKPVKYLSKKIIEKTIINQSWFASKFEGETIYNSPQDKNLKLKIIKDEKQGGYLFQFFVLSSAGKWYKGINKRANSENRIIKILDETRTQDVYEKGSW